MADTISNDKVVEIHYTLRDDAGEVVDSSDGTQPLAYLHGHDNIVPGLNNALTGKAIGETVKISVPPQEGYGLPRDGGKQTIAKESFPAEVQIGMQFLAEGEEGQAVPIWVAAIEDDMVTIDINHPMAGVTLHFEVSVVSIRAATEEEIAHGHPHGPGGHHH